MSIFFYILRTGVWNNSVGFFSSEYILFPTNWRTNLSLKIIYIYIYIYIWNFFERILGNIFTQSIFN